MRTTLSLDDDVAVALDRMRKRDGRTFKELVNEAIRVGLARMTEARIGPTTPLTHPVSLGRPTLPDVDDVSDTLAVLEGDDHR